MAINPKAFTFHVRKDEGLIVEVPTKLLPEFIEMVMRANNTWQDRSQEMKEFRVRMFDLKIALIEGSKKEVINP